MVTALLLLLASQVPAPPVRVWLGSGPPLAFGEDERVYVQTSTDGNFIVLHARADGRVEILFPSDPASDPFVRAGAYEIRGPASSGLQGGGMVVAALSPDPVWFDEFVHNGTWDAAALTGTGMGGDPEALLTDIVQRMLGDGSFSYDVVAYTVAPRPAASAAAAGYTLEPAGACIECSFTQVDLVVRGNPPARHFSHRRRRAPSAHAVPPDPAAIAVYSVHRPVAPEPLRAPLPGIARSPRPVAPSATLPRRRTPEVAAAASPGPATVAVRAVPLVARARSAAAQAAAVPRSQLLMRVVHAARSPSSALVAVTEPASSWVAAPAPTLATAGLIAVPASAPAPVAAPEPRVVGRPDARIGAVRAGTADAAPASARSGSATGVGLRAVHTAGWRH